MCLTGIKLEVFKEQSEHIVCIILPKQTKILILIIKNDINKTGFLQRFWKIDEC